MNSKYFFSKKSISSRKYMYDKPVFSLQCLHFFRALNSAEGLGSNDARSVKLSYRAEIIPPNLCLWGLLQFPWGMHICHYDEGKKKEAGLVCMAFHVKRTLEIGMGVKFKFIFKILDLTIFFKCCFERYMNVDFNKIP